MSLTDIGTRYELYRSQLMSSRAVGLTALYNRFHQPKEGASDIELLRTLQIELDHAVTSSYGWSDLDLGHGFHQTRQGIRFTLSESARRIVLDRLLALNHERYEEEVRSGLHEKKAKRGISKRNLERTAGQGQLL